MFWCIVGGIACAAAGALIAWIVLDRELRSLARMLTGRWPSSNVRLSCDARTPGMLALVRAVNERLDALQAERRALEEEQQGFREGLACLSHDIRTPLAGAQGYLQLAARTADAAERERYEQAAAERLDAVRTLLDDLFVYTQTQDEAFALACEPLRAAAVLEEVLVGAYPQFVERGWVPEVHSDEDVLVFADEQALERVFTNLISNSLRHGAGAPRIAQHGETFVFVNALPEGVELDEAALFERFYRGRSARTGTGSGLGLSTVRALVEEMGGAVSARIEGGELHMEVRLRRAEEAVD